MPSSPLDRREDEVVVATAVVRVFVDPTSGLDEEQTIEAKDQVAERVEDLLTDPMKALALELPAGHRVAWEVE